MVNCDHQEHHKPSGKVTGRLLMALGVIVVFMVVEVVGGVISGSLALLADATHMLTDALALGLAASAQFFSARPADNKLHFGYRRAQVLAAFVNGVLLSVLLVWIVFEALHRFMNPVEVNAQLMLWVAIAGFIANAIAFFILHRRDEVNLNMRGAMLHVVSDLLGSAAAIAAALVIAATGWLTIDPLLSIAVAFLIGVSALRLVRETGHILLEGAPTDIDVAELETSLVNAVQQIKGVHSTQISQITPEQPRLTMHACVGDARDAASALVTAKTFLEKKYQILHSTIQIEIGDECPDGDHKHEPVRKFEVHEGKSPVSSAREASGGTAAFAAD
ncbi:cation diffusion facilitator family transporter [Hyphococcus sp.]|uniref:cation diffusion facilitator family transporter n=1 Tax=Hyphococcus sp. TaxID=2038636 RepID=UPI00208180E4|nr:MAG: zinc transporter ZitB [Marinicaulis sp.]